MANPEDPLVAFQFALELEGKIAGSFQSVSGIGSETEVIEEKGTFAEGGTYNKKIPGRLTWTEITLKRGVTSTYDFWEWRQDVVDGKIDDARTNCSIIAMDQTNSPIAGWDFELAWPSKISGPEMDAGGQDYMVEELTIVHEGMLRVQ